MDTTQEPFGKEDLERFQMFWADEVAAAELYRGLGDLADGSQRELFHGLAEIEDKHAGHWAGLLASAGREPQPRRLPWRHKFLLWTARRFGVERVIPSVIRAEAADRDKYRASPHAPTEMAAEEASHGRELALAANETVGPALAMADARHRTGAGGSLRAAVFGANDGLVSNFALIMGVAGGTGDPAVIMLAGVAGLVAGAGSMAAGEWVSVRAQRELYEREIAVERWELEEFPDDEQLELELIYRAKGLDDEASKLMAERIMADKSVALDTLVREELGLNPEDLGSPWGAAASSFVSFAIGALIPLVPFWFLTGWPAIAVAATLSVAALAAVGTAISAFTGKAVWKSALRMVLIGGFAAVVTYGVGSLVGVAVG